MKVEDPSSAAEASSAIADAAAGAAAAAGGAAAAAAPSQRSPYSAPTDLKTTLYVGNIFFEVNEQSLEDYFSRYGAIKSTKIIYDARGLSKG
jgi:hypothetical protein